jgi:hypothetical protein
MKLILILLLAFGVFSCSILTQPKVVCALGDLAAACINKTTEFVNK